MGIDLDVTTSGATSILVGLDARAKRLIDLEPELTEAMGVVYEATREWYDSDGEGEWPPLAASTVADKVSQGYADPERPLYADGNLYESATSPYGPYSFHLLAGLNGIVFGVDWARGRWQIPVVHFYGTSDAGKDHNVRIPARPIWPRPGSASYLAMMDKLNELMLRGI